MDVVDPLCRPFWQLGWTWLLQSHKVRHNGMSARKYWTEPALCGLHRRRRRVLIQGLACLLLAKAALGLKAQSSLDEAAERVRLPLFTEVQQTFSGASADRDYFLQLPEHLVLRSGSELRLVLHPAPQLGPQVCALGIAVNDRTVVRTNLHGVAGSALADPFSVEARVPEDALATGWNRISLRFVLHPTPGTPHLLDNDKATWTVQRSESYLSLAFERLPLFSALARLPQSLVEEKLLHPDADSPFASLITPAISILIPGRSRDVHLRAVAILGARLGQLGYLSEPHCRLQALESWKAELDQRDGVIIGRRDQLGSIELPAEAAAALASLSPGRGLLAEFFHGPKTNLHRVLLLSGADDPGLEKAALTLGSAPALAGPLANPAVIDSLPEMPAELDMETKATRLRLSDGGPIQLRGLYLSEQSISNWRLPPGFQFGPHSALHLRFTASPFLRKERSALEVLVNGTPIATMPLGIPTSSVAAVELPLPRGLAGRDPMNLTLRARLDLGDVDCEQRGEENAWVKISGDSSLEASLEPVPVAGLNQVQRFLLADRFARKAAFLVPAGPTLEQVRTLLALWLDLGRNLRSSAVLWPEVVTYRSDRPPDAARLKGRAVLLLGAVAQWREALPPGKHALALVMSSVDSRLVEIQGRPQEVDAFDPTLVFAQMLPSPWSSGETLVLAGGWKDYATPALRRLLLDPASATRLHDELAALDALGRAATYDGRQVANESFAEQIRRRISPGLTVEESARLVAHQEQQWTTAMVWNRILFLSFGSLLFLLLLSRLWLMWEQVRFRRKSLRSERSVGETP